VQVRVWVRVRVQVMVHVRAWDWCEIGCRIDNKHGTPKKEG
jgi:hypothetical protein